MSSALSARVALPTLAQSRHRFPCPSAVPQPPRRDKHVSCAEGNISAQASSILPSSREEAITQAVDALQSSLAVGKKRRKKGQALWAGVKRLVVEIPVQESSEQAELELAGVFLKSLPPAAGTPLVVFGSQATTEHARKQDVPFIVYSLAECFADGEDEELKGPLILMGPSAEQAAACQRLINNLWSGRLVLVANAGWMREDSIAAEIEAWMRSFDVVYYFLPVQFAGMLGGNRMAHILKGNVLNEDASKWMVYLQEDGADEVSRIGQMDSKPTNADLEACVYNFGAGKSPLTKAAKAAKGLFDRFKK